MDRFRAGQAVTAHDVARLAGVSATVVSYVVNDGPRPVATETAERVRRAIDMLGYLPNLNARSLRSGESNLVGLVLPDCTNPYFAELAQAIQQEADRHHRVVVVTNHGYSGEQQQRGVADLTRRGVGHILIASPAGQVEQVDGSAAVVLLDCATAVPGAATIGPASDHGSALAVRHLIHEHGHGEVAIALGETGEFGAENRERGWRRACLQAGRPEGPLERAPFTRAGGYAIGHRLLSGRRPPKAIFASSDLQAFGVLHAARELGLRVPDDLALITFDGTSGARFSWPSLTAVSQPLRAMAAAALREVMVPGGPRPRHQVFDMQLTIRRSCGCPGPPGPDVATRGV